ncbi:helix-turn-helix domain-containing protein [Micrococcus luteus]|nr:helix-turn-helix domain-containing protein [Micrococcus luteus]
MSIRDVATILAAGMSIRDVATMHGVSERTISRVRAGNYHHQPKP